MDCITFYLRRFAGVGNCVPVAPSRTVFCEALYEVVALDKLSGDFVQKVVLFPFSEVQPVRRTLRIAVEYAAAARVVRRRRRRCMRRRCLSRRCVGAFGCGRPGDGEILDRCSWDRNQVSRSSSTTGL